jgi:tetratricopeptide (TPR) repeat protein
MYFMRGQHQEAISEMERGLALDPNDPVCHLNMGLVLALASRPKEAIEYLNRGMRLDPHNPSRYLAVLGQTYFIMGKLEEAAGFLEKAIRLNPGKTPAWTSGLAVCYLLLGREQEARALVETTKIEMEKVAGQSSGGFTLRYLMTGFTFKDRAVAERYANALLKLGVPPAKMPGGYFPAFKENQLTGEEIKRLLFGSAITGYVYYPQEFGMDYKKNGEFTWRGTGPISSDTGKSWIEGDAICWQYEKRFGGIEYCGTVFRYPGGSYEDKNEYFWGTDLGYGTFSLVK